MGAGVPRMLKQVSFWLVAKLWIDRDLDPALNSFRAALGLTSVKRTFRDYVHTPQLVIGLFPE